MVLEYTESSAKPVGLDGAVYTTCLVLLSAKLAHYQIWYICIIACLDVLFSLPDTTLKIFIFIVLFLFRYIRLIVNLIAFHFYKSVVILDRPTFTADDVTVIVPTVGPYGQELRECIDSIKANRPAQIIIVTAGSGSLDRLAESIGMDANISIKHCSIQNKRAQICEALPEISTPITVLCDDHVFWGQTFIPSVLAPFEEPTIGCVGTNKRVRRTMPVPPIPSPNFWSDLFASFWNMLGCLYLERHNFELAATNTIDGGVFVISGRTSAHRTSILQDNSFTTGFLNERLCFGRIGPLNADDDNFITRWMVSHGWKIKMQYSDDACIETTLGEYPKFLFQCARWARTTWRSNPRSLLCRHVWKTQPWCVYSVLLTSLVNFALFYDGALGYMVWASGRCNGASVGVSTRVGILMLWILCSKLVKPFPHFRRYPRDLLLLPGYILFGYVHSLVKLYALVTFGDIAWGSRPLDDGKEGL